MRLPISISKLLRGLHREKSALDDQDNAKEAFNKAGKGSEETRSPKPKAPGLTGSRMVRENAPTPGLRPSGHLRDVPDRFAAARRLEAEQKEAAARNRIAEMANTAKLLAERREGRDTDYTAAPEDPVFGNPPEHTLPPAEMPAHDNAIGDGDLVAIDWNLLSIACTGSLPQSFRFNMADQVHFRTVHTIIVPKAALSGFSLVPSGETSPDRRPCRRDSSN